MCVYEKNFEQDFQYLTFSYAIFWMIRIPSSGNLSITSADVLVEDMFLESYEASGGIGTAQDITPDIVKETEAGGQLVQYIQLTDSVLCTGTSH